MEFDATFLIAAISFIIFVFVMNAVFYAPILKIMQKRNDFVENNFDNAKKINEQTKEKEFYHSNELDKIRTNAQNTLNSQMQKINAEKSKVISDYKTQLADNSRCEKEKLKQSALNAKETLDNTALDIAKNISTILFGNDINIQTINKSQIREE